MKKLLSALLCAALVLSLALPALAAGYASGDRPATATPDMADTCKIISLRVTLRETASYSGKTLASIPSGTVLPVLGESEGWLQVRYSDKKGTYTGWIVASYAVRNPQTLILRAANVAAYAAPSRSAKTVGQLASYTELPVIGTWGDFFIVSLRDAAAFIHSSAKYWTAEDLAVYDQAQGSHTVRAVRATTLRTGPDKSWASVEKLAAGKEMTTVGTTPENGWYVVRHKTYIAYLNAEDVEIVQ